MGINSLCTGPFFPAMLLAEDEIKRLTTEFRLDDLIEGYPDILRPWNKRPLVCPRPPHMKGIIEKFLDKLEKESPEFGLLILPVDTSANWFHRIYYQDLRYSGVHFYQGRLVFTDRTDKLVRYPCLKVCWIPEPPCPNFPPT
jgi:hypothetical protein